MRLLHVIAQMDPKMGGVGQAVRTIVAGLTDLGVQNEIVSLDADDASFLANEKAVINANGPGKGPWFYSRKLSCWLHANLFRFDAVIVHGIWLYNGYATRQALRFLRKKESNNNEARKVPQLFIMPHGMLDPYFQKAAGRKLKALRNWLFWKLTENKLVNEADGLLFTCLTELQLAREPFCPYKPKREFVVGLGTEAPSSYTTAMQQAFLQKCPGTKGRSYFLFLSRIHEKKGVDVLIKAYKKVFEKNDFITELVIAGPGIETSYGKQMQQLVSDLNLTDHIFFTGMLAGDAKWGAFYGSEAFVLPSHQENFGIAIVEALACGKPVIISNQVNIWQEIKLAESGLVGNDSEDAVAALFKVWETMSDNEKANMGEKGRALYKRNFAINRVASKFLEAVSSI